MIGAGDFMAAAAGRGYTLYTGVPCSYLTPFINAAIDSPALRYVPAANEGDAVAIAAGASLAGRRAVAMFQNSGLGNAVNPLTSLTWTFRIPVLLVVTWRAEPGGAADEPQHELMGPITPRLLELMEIPWQRFPAEPGAIAPALEAADASMARTGLPYAFVMQKGSVGDRTAGTPGSVGDPGGGAAGRAGRHRRRRRGHRHHRLRGPGAGRPGRPAEPALHGWLHGLCREPGAGARHRPAGPAHRRARR
jgi:sulfopyruvate decarboxylase TPP-binding subunit